MEMKYPQVVGHEIIGKVVSTGKNVKNHKVGDFVGVGGFLGERQVFNALPEDSIAFVGFRNESVNLCTQHTGPTRRVPAMTSTST